MRNEYTPQLDVCAMSHKGLISQLNNTIVREHKLSQACDKYKVSPSTEITIKLDLPLELVHRGQVFFSTRIDMDIMFTLLIMDTMIWKELTLQSLYLTTTNGFQ